MEIPLYVFFILYLCGIGVFLLWAFFNFYHLIKYGFFDFSGKLHGFMFIGFSIVVIAITILLLKDVPWFDTISFGSIIDADSGSELFKFDSKRNTDL